MVSCGAVLLAPVKGGFDSIVGHFITGFSEAESHLYEQFAGTLPNNSFKSGEKHLYDVAEAEERRGGDRKNKSHATSSFNSVLEMAKGR